MRNIYLLVSLFLICSCVFKPKQEFRFVYGFENQSDISNIELKKTIDVIKNRLAHFGVENTVNRFGENQLEVIIKANELNIERVDELISNEGKLELWHMYKGEAFFEYTSELLSNINETNKGDRIDIKSNFEIHPGYQGGPIIFNAKVKDTGAIMDLINSKDSRLDLPNEYKNVKFLWGIPDESGSIPLYAAKSNSENKPPLTGEVIINASQSFGYTDRPEVSIQMNEEGALIWERMTEKAYREATSIAITLNDLVYSAPGVTAGPITGGKSSISGDFTIEEAQNLAIILTSGKIIPKLKLLEQTIVPNR
ncbi:hypothetical protein EYD45_16215 [Hyunsoonleella flava]|uniref:SecDF P1 head subdomain domain-containing protein n=1 Tax=Hyunsoonleella flava TaxID=2527939 RepID=A0A4Q9FA33_9FLAO|nr:hypothetical protein [Hyunsoonleella flava]TBM98871.1 hypothetical protein EYD45_16215 [Hyunsoonleella flava]